MKTSSGVWTVVLEVLATVFMLPFMYIGAAERRSLAQGRHGVDFPGCL